MRSTTQLLCLTAALATTALAQDAYAPAANVSSTTGTGATTPATTTVDVEPCDEETQTPIGTGGTGGPPPATSGTWVMPTAPTASSQPSDAPPKYTGAAAMMQPAVGGLLMAAVGLLPALV